jgi:hypothetical protein
VEKGDLSCFRALGWGVAVSPHACQISRSVLTAATLQLGFQVCPNSRQLGSQTVMYAPKHCEANLIRHIFDAATALEDRTRRRGPGAR